MTADSPPEHNHDRSAGAGSQEPWEVSPQRVRDLRDAREPLVLVDCRTHAEHAIARIEGAELVPLQELASRLPELEEHAEQRVVVFCHHGQRSLRMAAVLREQAFEDVKSMAGGIDRWSREVDPTVPRY